MALILAVLLGKLFALIIGFIYFKFLPFPYKLILLLVFIAIPVEVYGYYIGLYRHQHNGWLFNFYIFAETWLMGSVAALLATNYRLKKIFFGLLVISTLIWLVVIIVRTIYVFATVYMIWSCSLLTAMYLILLFNNSLFSSDNILKNPVFWLSFSTILCFGCDIPYMGLNNYLYIHAPSLGKKLSNINTVLDIIRYPLIAISFILLGRQKNIPQTA